MTAVRDRYLRVMQLIDSRLSLLLPTFLSSPSISPRCCSTPPLRAADLASSQQADQRTLSTDMGSGLYRVRPTSCCCDASVRQGWKEVVSWPHNSSAEGRAQQAARPPYPTLSIADGFGIYLQALLKGHLCAIMS